MKKPCFVKCDTKYLWAKSRLRKLLSCKHKPFFYGGVLQGRRGDSEGITKGPEDKIKSRELLPGRSMGPSSKN